MTDIATLGIEINASQADEAGAKLDNLTSKGERAENQARKTKSATDELADRMAKLKSSVDPAGVAISKVNSELAEAAALYKSGALSANEYAQAQAVLNQRAEMFAGKQTVMNARLLAGAGAARLTASETLNLSRQFADIGVTAAMGMNPLMILIQQGPQIADIMKTSGLSIRDVAIELGVFFKILKRVEVANIEAATASQAGAVAAGELATANAAVAATANAAATAEARLAAATGSAAVGAEGAALAAGQAAVANTAMGATATAAGAATTVALAPIALIIGAIVAVLALVALGFKMFAVEATKNVGDLTKELGLNEKQLDQLKKKGTDTGITMGDSFKGFFMTVKDLIVEAFGPQIEWLKKAFSTAYDWIVKGTVFTIKAIVGSFVGAFYAIKAAWKVFPSMIGDVFYSAVNLAINAINWLVKKSIDGLNFFVGKANTLLPEGWQIKEVSAPQISNVDNPYAGKAKEGIGAIKGAAQEGFNAGSSSVDSFGKRWQDNSEKAAKDRISEDAGEPGATSAGPRAKTGGGDKETEFEKQAKAAKEYAASLREETAEIGKNAVQLKMMAAERAAALAPTKELKQEIVDAALAWKEATKVQAEKEFNAEFKDRNEQAQFELSLGKMNAEQRAEAVARREIEMRQREVEKQGIVLSSVAIADETQKYIELAKAKGALELKADDAREYANQMRNIADAVKEAANAFGELFGSVGQGFADLISITTDYQQQQIDAEAAIAEARARYGAESMEAKRVEAAATANMARAELDYYGDMIGAAKRMFKEKSTGWKILEAIERAYRAYQMIAMIIEMTNTAKSIALDGTKTASSVANSGLRATADGIAAFAKTIASLPFPINLIAGAAVVAALVAMGVKMAGGGKGGSSASATDSAKMPTYSGAVDEYGAPTSSYSVLKAGQTRVSNDNGTGASAPGVAASSASGSVGNSVSIGDTHLTIQGNVDSDALPQLQQILQQHKEQTVQETRQAVNEDIAARSSRQRIGGS